MAGYINKKTNDPMDVLTSATQAERDSMWGPIPGEVVSYDSVSGTATVQPLYRSIHNGVAVDMPVLYEVPIDLPRTANAGLTFPIPSGTKVMLTPQMRAIDEYEEGGFGDPYDARSFHLSNMRASIAGGDSLSAPLPNVDPENTHLRFSPDGDFGIKGSPDGKVAIDGKEGNIYDLLVQVVEILGSETTTVSSGSSAGVWPLTHQAQFAALAAKLRGSAL